jgi:4-amino-4-deoxy-L-arabinose transferase-like glycosyltransferase
MSPTAWKLLFVVVVSIIVVFIRSAKYDFVTYDDYELVAQNEQFLSNPSSLAAAFTTHAFTTHRAASGYYRPLLLISYIADYRVWGLNPTGYHLTNVVLHCCSAVALFLLLEQLFHHSFASFLGALLFALHPVQTESVGWVAGRNDVMLGLFIVLMALFYALSLREGGKKEIFRALSVVAFTAALFTKESAAFYLLLLPVIEVTQRDATLKEFLTLRYVKTIAPFVICLFGYLAIRAGVVGGIIGAEALYGATPFVERLAHIPSIVSEQLKFILVPFGYSVVHPFDRLLWQQQPWTLVSWCIVLVLIAVIRQSWSKKWPGRAGIAWFAIGLLPLLGLFPLAVQILEHRLYVPMAGVAIAVAGGISISRPKPFAHRALVSISVALLAVLAILSMNRLQVWQNSETLWRDAIEKAPSSGRSYFNLAGYYYEHRQFDKTIGLMESYIGLQPDDPMGYIQLRQTFQVTGRADEAAETERKLVECYRRIGDSTKANDLIRQSGRDMR